MGIYLNPGNENYKMALNSKIYVDKSALISYTNSVLKTEQRFVCVSRPRRFGKSMTANMLCAYYGKNVNSDPLFQNLSISSCESYRKCLNQYNVIFLNMQTFLGRTGNISEMITLIRKSLLRDLLKAFPNVDYLSSEDLIGVLLDIYTQTSESFIFIIDEWDCIFREHKSDSDSQKLYLDFIRGLLKDQSYVALAYMTGILPIKKYGSHSALNMFDEFSMANPGPLAEFVGFTEAEAVRLCATWHMDPEEMKQWYDGYYFESIGHIYNPRSVVSAMLNQQYDNYWNKTETFEALLNYIRLNYDGLQDAVIELLSGGRREINTATFSNDMTSFHSADDVLTLLIHLGYLGYDLRTREVFIPNSEISSEFCNAVTAAGWDRVAEAIRKSDALLTATLEKNADLVADMMEASHMETSILTYNNENALSCTIALAYYSAKEYYQIIREFPSGKGFADLVFLPWKNHLDKPALIVELKWDRSARSAINQIKEKQYINSLKDYNGRLLLVGISYDPKTKKHSCLIEEFFQKQEA